MSGEFASIEFFNRPTALVAKELVGQWLMVDEGTDQFVKAQIVETEAYLGNGDPASHAARGPTQRSQIMFGIPGVLYVYLIYGMYFCANIVTEKDGVAGAVLLRSAFVDSGEDVVRARLRQSKAAPKHSELLRGPGKLCTGLAITKQDNGINLLTESSRIRVMRDNGSDIPIGVSPRIGINSGSDLQLRYCWQGHPAVSGNLRSS